MTLTTMARIHPRQRAGVVRRRPKQTGWKPVHIIFIILCTLIFWFGSTSLVLIAKLKQQPSHSAASAAADAASPFAALLQHAHAISHFENDAQIQTDTSQQQHSLRPLQKIAARAPNRPPKNYKYKPYDVPKENEIPFIELDIDDTILTQVHQLVQEQPELYQGREHLLGMLLEMNMNVTTVDPTTWKQVPVWSDIQRVHGDRPIVYGLDTCRAFRDKVPAVDRHLAIAGMFNTGEFA